MPSVRDLRDRIRSLRNTQQITKAMKQVAAAKIRRAELAQREARPYADALSEMLHDLITSVGAIDHPFMRPGREGAPRGVIVVTADKGLAGAFNANLTRTADLYQRQDPRVVFYAVGLKARNSLRRLPPPTALAVALSAGPKVDTAREVAAKVSDDFTAGTISEIVLISAKLVTRMSQRPEMRSIVPIVAEQREVAASAPREIAASGPRALAATGPREVTASGPRALVEFAPSPEAVLTRLLPKYLEFTLFSAMLETEAAFFAAQLVAMTNATDNANKLIDELTIAMNKARQAAITKEMLEIVGGAEALVG